MRCMEIFYNRNKAEDFIKTLVWNNANAEIEETKEPNDDLSEEDWENCFIVWYNPKPYKR